jgi:hypothetical protein
MNDFPGLKILLFFLSLESSENQGFVINSLVRCQILRELGEVPISDNQIRDFKYLLIT